MTKYSERRGKAVTQRDGSALANANCRMAAIATGLDFHTNAAKTSTGAKMRSYTDDQSGGTDSGDAVQSWSRGYGETLRVGDGGTFDDVLADLRAGREIQLDVWAASVGGVCLSGTGAYGHTIAVAPDYDPATAKWAVSDPWCNPPQWAFVAEAKLRAGAEEWGRRVTKEAHDSGGDTSGPPDLVALRKAAKRLMSRHNPSNPAAPTFDATWPAADTGGGVVFYTTTKALPIASKGFDMAIKTGSSLPYATPSVIDVAAGVDWYEDANLTIRMGEFESDKTLAYIGLPIHETAEGGARAVVLQTMKFSEDGSKQWYVAYIHASGTGIGDPYNRPVEPEPTPEPPEPPDYDAIRAERDAEWIDWLTPPEPGS